MGSGWTYGIVDGCYFLIRNKRGFSFITLFLSLFAYHNARIYVPVVAGILFIAWNDKKSRLLSIVLAIVSAGILLAPSSRARSGIVGIVDSGAVAKIESQRNASHLPEIAKKLFYNRPMYFIQKAAGHYLDYFSPGYLFFHGGTQYQFSVPERGLLSYADLPFFYLGLVIVMTEFPLLTLLFLIAPIPAAITQDRFAVVRSTIMIPFVMLATSAGLVKFQNKYLRIAYLVLLPILLGGYYYAYSIRYRENYSQSWQYGYKQAVEYLMSNKGHYDNVIFTKRYGEPHEYLLWYGKINPRTYLANLESGKVNWNFHDNWYWIDGIDNVVFVNDWELNNYLLTIPRDGKNLVLSSADNPAPEEPLLLINFLDGTLAFKISKQ